MNELWDIASTLGHKAFVMLTGPKFVQPVLSVLALVFVVELVTKRRWSTSYSANGLPNAVSSTTK